MDSEDEEYLDSDEEPYEIETSASTERSYESSKWIFWNDSPWLWKMQKGILNIELMVGLDGPITERNENFPSLSSFLKTMEYSETLSTIQKFFNDDKDL